MVKHASQFIQLGDYIIIQRQKYTKLQKFSSLDSIALLGKEAIELRGLLDQPYSATFKMCPKELATQEKRNRNQQRLHSLQLCSDTDLRNIREVLGISASGLDNRNIQDDGDSQALGADDIEQIRAECKESAKIIEKIVENSKTFHTKTEYSQEKYLKKKEKKYFEFVKIHKPTIRLITEIYYRQDPDKIMNIRLDTLAQIISYSGVSSSGNYLLYESGTNGLLPAVFMNSIGSQTDAKLVHMHPGNVPQKQAVLALNLPDEQLQRCISVNIYSVLRHYYQSNNMSAGNDVEEKEPICKKPKLSDEASDNDEDQPKVTATQQRWQQDNERAFSIIQNKFDSLVIVAKEHPINIVNELLNFLKPSRPICVFSLCREVLMELYVELKTNSNVTNLHLTSNWMRQYQLLPNRTHPEVNMNGNSGYLLCGYTVN